MSRNARLSRALVSLAAGAAGLSVALLPTAVATAAPAPTPSPAPGGQATSGPNAPSAPAANPDAPALELALTAQSPAVTYPSDTLALTLEITNHTAVDVVNPWASISVQQEVPRNRAALLNWFNADAPPRARLEWNSTLEVTLPAAAQTTVEVAVPMDQLDFPVRYDNWGARGLEIAIRDPAAGTAAVRTMGVFYPDEFEAEPVGVTVLAPATPTASEWAQAVDQAADAATRRSSADLAPPAAVARAAELLATGVDVALDPVLATTPGLADPLASSIGRPGGILALPWGDPDLAVLPVSGPAGEEALTTSLTRGESEFATAPRRPAGLVLWPATPGVTADALAVTAEIPALGVVLEGPREPRSALVERAQSARADVVLSDADDETRAVELPAVLSDATLTALLLGELTDAGLTGPAVDAVNPGLLATQLAIAYTAVVAREGAEPVPIAAVVPRGAAQRAAGEADVLAARLAALVAQPWVERTSVARLLVGSTERVVDVTELVAAGVLAEEPPPLEPTEAVLSEAESLTVEAAALASAFPDGSGLAALTPVLDVAGSTAWRLAGRDGAAVTQAVRDELTAVSDAVAVVVPSSVNLAANDGAIPVTLTNELGVPILAHIEARPQQLLLRVETLSDVRLEPGEAQSVRLPVEAIANGQTRVDVAVVSPDGAVLGSAATFEVQVRAEWEGTAVGVAAAALAVLLVVGLARAFRRGRRDAHGVAPGTQRPDEPVVAASLGEDPQ